MKLAFASDVAREAVADTDQVCQRRVEFEIPHLRGYRINLVDAIRGNGYRPDDVAFDGPAELWFENVEAMEGGFGSAIGSPFVQDSAEHCAQRVRLLTVEHIII